MSVNMLLRSLCILIYPPSPTTVSVPLMAAKGSLDIVPVGVPLDQIDELSQTSPISGMNQKIWWDWGDGSQHYYSWDTRSLLMQRGIMKLPSRKNKVKVPN